MSTPFVLDQIRKNFERAVLNGAEQFRHFDQIKRLCKNTSCEYCLRAGRRRDVHNRNVILIRSMLERITPNSKPQVKLELDPRPGYGLWNGYITDDGYFINGRIGVRDESGDVGHAEIKEWYCSVRGSERARALLKIHAQYRSEVMLFSDSPLLTTAQLSTLSEIFIATPEELWFTFRYDLQHPMKDIPF